jgi:hypothetical protein
LSEICDHYNTRILLITNNNLEGCFTYFGIEVNLISLTDLKLNKKASGRFKDLNDLENLP